jgi:hypothetical protein
MVVVTGYSNKYDGLIFVHDGSKQHAIDLFLRKTNCHLMKDGSRNFAILADRQFRPNGEDSPGWEGWELFVGDVKNGFAKEAVCF